MLKADLHVHSNYSYDCRNKAEDIIRRCGDTGINCIAVADHGTAEGALKIQQLAPFQVIVAEEIMTPFGEVMGMFLQESIPNKIPFAEAVLRIREQDGLVCVPHPFDKPNRHGLGGKKLEQFIDDIDIIEVFNARSPLTWFSKTSLTAANRFGKAKSAGSDAHTINEIGSTYIEMPDFCDKNDFLSALEQGRIHGRITNPFVLLGSSWARIRKVI
ncbi:MAG TPA: phosphotransferase [Dehalococcoidia bacterium]|jgi:predicted metal-dependent phosphoesterase TrpH|nr:phosphotransferase [Dehalococcoidia bacterium]